jgi:hypothetical protein
LVPTRLGGGRADRGNEKGGGEQRRKKENDEEMKKEEKRNWGEKTGDRRPGRGEEEKEKYEFMHTYPRIQEEDQGSLQ